MTRSKGTLKTRASGARRDGGKQRHKSLCRAASGAGADGRKERDRDEHGGGGKEADYYSFPYANTHEDGVKKPPKKNGGVLAWAKP
jgi:hypothetical protein